MLGPPVVWLGMLPATFPCSPAVEDYIADNEFLARSKRLHHCDPCVANIITDPETIKRIPNGSGTMVTVCTALSDWSYKLLPMSKTSGYIKWRDIWEEMVGKISPAYLKVLRAGKDLREMFDYSRSIKPCWGTYRWGYDLR
ncbi:hypothetical protein D9757_003270 [Collybiopsis confluens]|uniref:Uncharacterized protein n=1 Tax=Collybiopsis confluens TaxID=2823264 RepID=A0A8H5HYZ7_9AGAR|nr:hypothetical protein D9757_003270 [Collybiopsis confluens]